MSWRNKYTGKGRFRNAVFLVKSSEMVLGRRVTVHEYPQSDIPYVEDLGLKAREFTIDAFVIGENYHKDRDAFIEALEMPGPGTLVHPYLGTMRVSLVNARKRESTSEGGRCQFTLTFTIAGEKRYPDQQADTQNAVELQADKSLADSINDFADTFSVLNQAAEVVQDVVTEISNVMGAIETVVSSVIEPVTALIRAPAEMAVAIAGSITRINALITKPFAALNIYKALFNTGNNSPSIPTTTSSRKQQTASTAALHNIIKRCALIEACRASSRATYATYNDAIEVRNALLDELDVQMQADGINDEVYLSLLDLRVTIVNDIRARGADLSRLKFFTPTSTLPALVIAHQLYGDATRDAEIVARNNIRHPGFVPGGEALEVLNV